MSTSESSADTLAPSRRFDGLVWLLIYGGLLSICLSFFLVQQAAMMSLGFLLGGGVALAAGIALIVVRAHLTST